MKNDKTEEANRLLKGLIEKKSKFKNLAQDILAK